MALDDLTLQQRRDRSALAILVPEVQDVIGAIRATSTEDGESVPPHITLYNPFLAPAETSLAVHARIDGLVERVPAFSFALARIDRFPSGILYLAPEPVAPFRDLIARLRREFPEVAPYWDRFSEVVPHVTIADASITGDGAELDRFADTIEPMLPVECFATDVVLIQRVRPSPAPWDVTGQFPLRA